MTALHNANPVQQTNRSRVHSQPPIEVDATEIDETAWDRLWLTFQGYPDQRVVTIVKSIADALERQHPSALVSLEEGGWEAGKFRVLVRIPVGSDRKEEYKFIKPVERALLAVGCDLESWNRVWREEPNDADRILALLTFRCDGCGKHFTIKDRAARLWFTGWHAQCHCSACAEANAEYEAKDWAAHAAAKAAGGKFFDEGHLFSDIDLQFGHGMEFRDAHEIYRVAYAAGNQGITVLMEPYAASLAFAEAHLERVQAIYSQITGRKPGVASETSLEAND